MEKFPKIVNQNYEKKRIIVVYWYKQLLTNGGVNRPTTDIMTDGQTDGHVQLVDPLPRYRYDTLGHKALLALVYNARPGGAAVLADLDLYTIWLIERELHC